MMKRTLASNRHSKIQKKMTTKEHGKEAIWRQQASDVAGGRLRWHRKTEMDGGWWQAWWIVYLPLQNEKQFKSSQWL